MRRVKVSAAMLMQRFVPCTVEHIRNVCHGRCGWMDAHLRGEVKHPTSPCCQAAWKVAPSGAWRCSACGGAHDRRSVAGW